MKTKINIDAERPEDLLKILEPSLSSDETVQYTLTPKNEEIEVEITTEGLGPLRGCTDTVFRLTTIARKLY